MTTTESPIHLRSPEARDGKTVWELVRAGGTLEANTPYCYLLLCSHFAENCIVAEKRGEIVGFIMAYRPPSDPEAVFVWQVGVAPAGRGQGLATKMLDRLIAQPGNFDARFLIATVDPDNAPSNKLFAAFARGQGATLETETGYGPELFPPGHAPEPLLRIGPLPTRARNSD
ncbi:MAG: diaminobutyrate acetyltransferase [Gammaproteobacteria bacterium]|nr:diaminobutyrate acetyltransferase [Gammaproteobacteria bacterium]